VEKANGVSSGPIQTVGHEKDYFYHKYEDSSFRRNGSNYSPDFTVSHLYPEDGGKMFLRNIRMHTYQAARYHN
jgi:hypothetical protein